MYTDFFKFSKRTNSTKLPDNANRTRMTVRLKEDCSILNPVIELDVGNTERPDFNYCHIPNFDRYYFIQDWSYYRSVWSAKLAVDVGATYKEEIESYTCFVERSASDYDVNINDPLLTSKQTLTKVDFRNETVGFSNIGCYIIRMVGGATTIAPTGVYMYALSPDGLGSLLSYLYDSGNFTDVLQEEFVKAVFNPIDYIISIKWFPFSPSDLPGSDISIWAGWFNTGVTGKLLTAFGGTIQFTAEPMERYYNDWRDFNPAFTRYSLYIPSYGNIDIPPEIMGFSGGLSVLASVDYTTGQFTCYIGVGQVDSELGCLTTTVGMIGYDVQIGTINANIGGALQSAIGIATGIASGNIGSTINAGVEAIKSATTPTVKTLGSTGSIQGIRNHPWFTITRMVCDSAEYPITQAGRPLMQLRRLGTLAGYVKCGNASISTIGYDTEKTELNSMLNTGIYIE